MLLATQGGYDPDTPEGARPASSDYVSRKDAKWVLLIVALLGLLFWPVYTSLRAQGQKQACGTNMGAIFKALNQYALLNGDRFPPVYSTDDGINPLVVDGRAYAWPSQVGAYMGGRASFKCPAAEEGECARVHALEDDRREAGFLVSYGMYAAMSTMPVAMIASPSTTALLAETSNFGARNTYNPVPFTREDGTTVPFDAFVIGWDDGNDRFSRLTKSVTRLAFYGTGQGDFRGPGVNPRHPAGIHVVFADGQLGMIQAPQAAVTHLGTDLGGLWQTERFFRRAP